MKKLFSIVLAMAVFLCLPPATVFAATTIDSVDIAITHPVHLANPDPFLQVYGNCQVDTTYNSDGFQNGLRWKEIASGKTMGASDTFVGGKQYELSVLLLSKTGYAFSASATTVTVNGDPVSLTVLDVNRAKASITLTADNLYINNVTITGLEAPKVGNTPDYSASVREDTCNVFLVDQEPVNNGVFWIDKTAGALLASGDQFVAGHVYVAGVIVQAKAGYEFPRNMQASVTGATLTEVQVSYDQPGFCQVAAEYPALAEEHTHTPSEWRTTGAYHYKACTECGDFLEQEDHTGGTATCTKGGKCTVCGYEYIEPNGHKWSPTYLYQTEAGHAWICADCKEHSEIVPHEAGPAGTPDAEVVCRDCGYVMAKGENTPAATEEPSPDATEEPSPDATEPSATDVPSATPGSSGMAEGGENTPPSQNEEPKTDWLLYVFIGSTGILLILLIALLCKKKKVNNTNRKDETQ